MPSCAVQVLRQKHVAGANNAGDRHTQVPLSAFSCLYFHTALQQHTAKFLLTGMSIRIVVKPTSGGQKLEREIEPSQTVLEVKEALSEECGILATDQRLIYKGQILKDERTLDSYGAVLGCNQCGGNSVYKHLTPVVVQVSATTMCST
jgi:hypothetical protein